MCCFGYSYFSFSGWRKKKSKKRRPVAYVCLYSPFSQRSVVFAFLYMSLGILLNLRLSFFVLVFLFYFLCSMILLVGHQRNIIQMTNNPLEGSKMAGRWKYSKMVWHHNLVLFGMRHLVITMMLLLDSTMIQIQVLLLINKYRFFYLYFIFPLVPLHRTKMVMTQAFMIFLFSYF